MTRQQEAITLKLTQQLLDAQSTLIELLQTYEAEEFVGINLAAELTGLSYRQLRTRAANGEIKTDRTPGGGKILFWRADLERLASHEARKHA